MLCVQVIDVADGYGTLVPKLDKNSMTPKVTTPDENGASEIPNP